MTLPPLSAPERTAAVVVAIVAAFCFGVIARDLGQQARDSTFVCFPTYPGERAER